MPLYADIVLPLAQPAYTFAVAEGLELREGTAVAVPFGRSRIYTGIVWRLHDRRPAVAREKTVGRTLYDRPLLDARQRKLWEWIADYYMCSLGEVMRVALPTLMKPSGGSEEEFSDDEFRPRTERYLALPPELHDADRLHEIFEKLSRRAPRQYAALLEIATADADDRISTGEMPRRLSGADWATLTALKRKGYIVETQHERTVECDRNVRFRLPELTPMQQGALDAIRTQFADKPTVLLQGVTGSGKTEIYIHLIAETLSRGGDVLLLVPEIALTAQLIERLERIFGSRVTAYHSKLTDRKRTETYLRLNRSAGGELVVGARSALFLPLGSLQLIVVDEEHDTGYKQSEPAPRYQARDCAAVMAQLFGARTLLGSATPSIESWSNAARGKYGRAELPERYGASQPPAILLSDTLHAVKRGERRTHFNKLLLDRIGAALDRHEQVMLFQNRRGFAPYVECDACGWTARCPQCNVTLTLHKGGERLVCHYCGHSIAVPHICPACGAGHVEPMGFGTEKVEEEIAKLFPEARVARLDRDSVTSERAFREIVEAFGRGESDILVGTQMITKGFDFGGVSLVGILNADNLLNNPDFRAAERAFQLMMQVAGRAGRREKPGEVVVQTADPGHPLLQQLVRGDYDAMVRTQLADREAFSYPPYARLVAITLRHRDIRRLHRGAAALGDALRGRFGRRLLGPMPPPVDRIRGEYLVDMLLKIESGSSFSRARKVLREEIARFAADPEYKSIRIVCNVDPQ